MTENRSLDVNIKLCSTDAQKNAHEISKLLSASGKWVRDKRTLTMGGNTKPW